jgi:hypothetical protein
MVMTPCPGCLFVKVGYDKFISGRSGDAAAFPFPIHMDFTMLLNRLGPAQNEPIFGQAAARLAFGDRTLLQQDL